MRDVSDKNMKTIPVILILLVLVSFTTAQAEESSFECDGYMTALYSDATNAIAICHGPYMKFGTKPLSSWSQCGDSIIYSIDKKNKKQRIVADCSPMVSKEFRVIGGKLEIQHYCNQHESTDQLPFILESRDIESGDIYYKYSYTPKSYTRNDIEVALELIEITVKSPFDGRTYFNNIYSSFYKIRDYAVTDYQYSKEVLMAYKERAVFDGEVAEALSEIIDDVLLIEIVTKSNAHR